MSEQSIDLANLDDAAYRRLYSERIEPTFHANEEGRVAAVASFRRRGMYAIAAALITGAVAFTVAKAWAPTLFFTLFVGVIGYAIAYSPLAALGKKLKSEYCTAIAEAMNATFQAEGFAPPAFERIKSLSLVPGYDRSSFEDLFEGAYKNSSFELYEAHLKQRRRDSKGRTHYSTVFRGQLIRMHFPRDFLGVTIVRRDAGVFNVFGGGNHGGRKLERVRLVDPEFEKAFEVWGTDQVEARYLLHPVMMQRLVDLETALRGKRLRCAFEGGELLVAVEGGNLFEPGDLFKPLADPARARRIVDEIASVVRVMDQVITAQNRPG